jgi:hypothetical protein
MSKRADKKMTRVVGIEVEDDIVMFCSSND